jgi:hypothetical protein
LRSFISAIVIRPVCGYVCKNYQVLFSMAIEKSSNKFIYPRLLSEQAISSFINSYVVFIFS